MKLYKFFFLCLPVFMFAADLSVEEKVGQILMVHFNGSHANEDARRLIQEVHAGGFVYYNWANELSSSSQVCALSHGLQELTDIPLFIAIDEEGGVVQRLKENFPLFPSNADVGRTKDPEKAESLAIAMGMNLWSLGINVNLAPVVDICGEASVIGERAFSDSPEEVVEFGRRALEGYRKVGIIPVLKHFPGLGDAIGRYHTHCTIIRFAERDC